MQLDAGAAEKAVAERIARPLGMDATQAAAAVIHVLVARTVGAVREITVERGHDPRTFSLLAFGGAGPLLAPAVAREMGIAEVIVPPTRRPSRPWGCW